MPQSEQHPNRENLQQFAAGRLSDEDSEVIESHLLACDECNELLSCEPGESDSLVELLRQPSPLDSDDSQPAFGETIVLPEDSATRRIRQEVSRGVMIDGYTIEDELGRGGVGVVYRAHHLNLKRAVALKVILAGEHSTEEERQRFRLEAETIAKLKHRGIVQIYEVGENDGRPYFALELMEGGDLYDFTERKPQPPRVAAVLCERLAQTIHYAHQQGIVHRDLKPGNVLLDSPTEIASENTQQSTQSLANAPKPDSVERLVPMPKVTDFGIAKQLDSVSQLTQTGTLLGTPAYMAPEQTTGNNSDITASCDIYALGAMLYELLTGRAPFMADNRLDTILMVQQSDPIPPSRLQPSLPSELETICLKCLEKEPERRYESAEALADDLRRFLNHEPIRARRVGLLRRGYLLYRRNQTVANLTAGFLMAVVIGTVVAFASLAFKNQQLDSINDQLTISNKDLAKQKKAALDAKSEAEVSAALAVEQEEIATQQRDEARRLLRIAEARGMAANSIAERDRDPALSLLLARAAVLMSLENDEPLLPIALESLVSSVAEISGEPFEDRSFARAIFSREADLLLTVDRRGEFKLGDLRYPNDTEQWKSIGRMLPIDKLEMSPDGRWVAVTLVKGGSMRLLGLPSNENHALFDSNTIGVEPPIAIKVPADPERQFLKFSPNSRFLATVGATENSLQLWDFQFAKQRGFQRNIASEKLRTSLSFSSNGRMLAYVQDDQIRLWDTSDRAAIETLDSLKVGRQLSNICFSPDGKSLAWNIDDEGMAICDLEAKPIGSSIRRLPRRGRGGFTQFSPDGKWLAAGYADHTISLWNLQQQGIDDSVTILSGHTGYVNSLDFSEDGNYLASAAVSDRNVLVWSLLEEGAISSDASIRPVILRGHNIGLRTANFITDGQILSRDEAGKMRLWKPDDYQKLSCPAVRRIHSVRTNEIAFDGNGNIISSADTNSIARWRPGQPATMAIDHWNIPSIAKSIDVSPNGESLAVGMSNGELHLYQLNAEFEENEPIVLSGPESPLRCVRFDQMGKRLAACTDSGDIRIWSIDDLSAEPQVLHCSSKRTWGLAFSPSGSVLATAHEERKVRVWNLAEPTAKPQVLTGHTAEVRAVDFRFDGEQLASSSHDETIRLWNRNENGDFELSEVLRGHVARVIDIDYSPDGKQLASAGFDKTVLLWDLTAEIPSTSSTAIRHFNNEVVAVEYSPDGSQLATATKVGETLIWTVSVEQLLQEAKRKAGRDFSRAERGKYYRGHIGRRGDGETGRRGDGETGRRGDGETGRRGHPGRGLAGSRRICH
jgi:WD40 repeat protein/serine/threonine protein kinase